MKVDGIRITELSENDHKELDAILIKWMAGIADAIPELPDDYLKPVSKFCQYMYGEGMVEGILKCNPTWTRDQAREFITTLVLSDHVSKSTPVSKMVN